MKFVLRKSAFALAISLIGMSSLHAAQDFWTGANNDNWFNNGNWSLGNPPTAADNAHIGTLAVPNATVRIGAPGATARNVEVGDATGSVATLRMNNLSSLNTVLDLNVGNDGNGTFVMSDFAQATIGSHINIGESLGAIGDATVRDLAVLTAAGNLRVGNNGTGTLTVQNFGSVSATVVNIGVAAGSNGTVNVSGDPGVFTFNLASTGNMVVGNDGTGELRIHDGGIVIAGNNGTIGSTVNGIGTAIVRGENSGQASRWSINNNLTVADAGIGSLEIHDGGEVDVGNNLRVALTGGSTGTALVEGSGGLSGTSSVLNVGNNAYIGGDNVGPGGDGMLTIRNNGVVNVTNDMTVWGVAGLRSTLAVDSTYVLNVGGILTFDGGRLHLGDGTNFINSAVLNNTNGATGMVADVDDGNTATISSILSGPGNLVKTGTGTLILDDIGLFNETHINNGTLVVANSVALGLGDVDLNDGTLRTPEGTPLAYFNSANFNANGGTFYVQVGSNTTGVGSDEMLVAGAANLDPANSGIFVHRVNGYNPANGDTITIIDTNTGTFGEFANAPQGTVAPNDFVGLIRPFIDYGNIDPGDVDLTFGFAAPFVSAARTPNQIATAAALDRAVAAGCIVNATNILGNIPVLSLKQAYDLIAPEELASIYEASFAQQMVNSLNLQHRMDDIRWGSTGFCADGFVIQDNHGYTKNDGKSVQDKNPVEQVAPPNYRWGTFITGHGELTKVGNESLNDPGADGYQLNNAGFTMGVDYRVTDHWAIGLSGAYSHTTGDLVNNGRLNTDGGKIGLYSTYYTGGFYVDASATGGWNQYDTRRNAYLGVETGSTDGAEFDGMIAVGYDWTRGCWKVGPYADFEYNYVEFNSFSEDDRPNSNTSSLIPLHFPDQNQSAYRTNLGFRVAHEQVMKPGEGLTVVPEVRAAWRHDFGDNSYGITSNFIGCDDQFTVHGPWIGSDSAVVDIGLTAYCTQQLSAYIFYQGQFGRDNYNNNAISGGMRFAF